MSDLLEEHSDEDVERRLKALGKAAEDLGLYFETTHLLEDRGDSIFKRRNVLVSMTIGDRAFMDGDPDELAFEQRVAGLAAKSNIQEGDKLKERLRSLAERMEDI